MRFPRFHIHRPLVRRMAGKHEYQTCSCGARRVAVINWMGYSPIPKDWPKPREGWVMP